MVKMVFKSLLPCALFESSLSIRNVQKRYLVFCIILVLALEVLTLMLLYLILLKTKVASALEKLKNDTWCSVSY